jgi:hypothetical protein
MILCLFVILVGLLLIINQGYWNWQFLLFIRWEDETTRLPRSSCEDVWGEEKGGGSDEAGKAKAKKPKEGEDKAKKKVDKRTPKNPLEMCKGPFFVHEIKGKRQ